MGPADTGGGRMQQQISELIAQVTGEDFKPSSQQSIGGGCINSAFKVSDGKREFFVKSNSADRLGMFEAEYDGLKEIAASNTIRVPKALGCAQAQGSAFLVMEYIAFGGGGSESARQLGYDLAAMHGHFGESFGWFRDNTIGSTAQQNNLASDWHAFFKQHRLAFQLNLAVGNGYGRQLSELGEQLLTKIHLFFDNYAVKPSLLHGDLWSGNFATADNGQPVIFDPAVYYGDREADIAMTELFGGFPAGFYQAYYSEYPMDMGYKVRKTLYNLYHILNHVNLFGSGYVGQARSMMQSLLSEV